VKRCCLVVLAACTHFRPAHLSPNNNEAIEKAGRKVVWRGTITKATFCKTCGRDAPVIVQFGDRIELTVPSCYPHAASKVGDHDKIQIKRLDTQALATEGELDITDCLTTHVIAKLWASWPDADTRLEALIDVDLVPP
jgi:hypothetical protein